MKDIKLTFLLKYPLGNSFSQLQELCKIWQILVIKASTNNNKVLLSMKVSSFEKVFNRKPALGNVPLSPLLTSFISSINVTEII